MCIRDSNKNTKNELAIFEEHVEIATKYDLPILIHTPHLEDKLKGTHLILDALKNARVDPERIVIDHVEEHTIKSVLDAGFWAGMTLYPESKCSPARAIDMLEMYGDETIWMNSACDWGHSDPLAVIKCALQMKQRKYDSSFVDKIIYENPLKFLQKCPNFKK